MENKLTELLLREMPIVMTFCGASFCAREEGGGGLLFILCGTFCHEGSLAYRCQKPFFDVFSSMSSLI
jgi:hypothetical protein